MGKLETVTYFLFLGYKITANSDCSHEIKRLLGRKAMTNLDSILKSRETLLCQQRSVSQSCGFSSSHVWRWELDHKEGWALKNWCLQTVVLERTLESPLGCKPFNPKGYQPWIFIAEVETPVLWPPDVRNWLIRKDPDGGKDWGQGEMGDIEDDMVG